jgi:hypothetical protein
MTGTQGATGTDEPTDKRRVIRLPRATRLLAAWLVCFAVAFAVIWFSPLGIQRQSFTSCPMEDKIGQWPGRCAPGTSTIMPAVRFALPVLALRAAALGSVLWVAYLGGCAVRSQVRFTVG